LKKVPNRNSRAQKYMKDLLSKGKYIWKMRPGGLQRGSPQSFENW